MYIETFIKQHPLGNKLIKDFPDLVEVSFATWYLINAIYCYKLKNLESFKRKNLVLGLIQENLMENSIQDCYLIY